MAGIGIWQLLIVLAIIVMLFGTKRLRNIGGDMGGLIRGFKNSAGIAEQPVTSEKDDAA